MAVLTIRWAQFLDGAITVDLEHDDTDDTIESYSVVNSHPTLSLRVTFFKGNGQQWRQGTIGPGQTFTDSRPFPGGVKTLADIPRHVWEII